MEGERFYSGIIRDITERKVAEHALHLANKSLNEKNEQLEALSAKLAKYLSRQVYDSIFEGRTDVRIESYRKELTVFFSDIEGFTDLTDRLEAEQISTILNSYLSEMAKIADECGGTIDKFIGDGVMIFFGDPETKGRKADALACVRMALRMRSRIEELRSGWEEIVGPDPIHVRIGINTGYCTVGVFGSDLLQSYTAIGTPINVAARLRAQAAPDGIVCGFTTHALVQDRVRARALTLTLPGIAEPVDAFEILDVAGAGAGPTGSGPISLTPREREVARLAADGHTAREIAGMLFIAERTVETHLARAYDKLGVRSKVELAKRASELDL